MIAAWTLVKCIQKVAELKCRITGGASGRTQTVLVLWVWQLSSTPLHIISKACVNGGEVQQSQTFKKCTLVLQLSLQSPRFLGYPVAAWNGGYLPKTVVTFLHLILCPFNTNKRSWCVNAKSVVSIFFLWICLPTHVYTKYMSNALGDFLTYLVKAVLSVWFP